MPGESLALVCKAAGEPLRLAILRVLSSESFGVQELAAIFGMPQPGMSHHLKVLAKAGLVVSRRQGNSIFYRLSLLKSEDDFPDFRAALYATVAALELTPLYQANIQRVYDDRALQSRLYFERNVDRFAENQGLLCELSQYLPNLRELLELARLPASSKVMEIGPGRGELLGELSRKFATVTALDMSEEMLALTKHQLAGQQRVHFINSSLEAFVDGLGEPAFDAVVLNMVLHHLPSPPRAFLQLRQAVKTGGFLLLADLASHNQDWARTSCGDVWLGFDPQDLKDWAVAAGFAEVQSLYLGLKNGFQIQLKLFRAVS